MNADPGLSEQQLRMLQCLAQGMRHRQIANVLGVKYGTVHSHALRLYAKLGACSAAEAVARGYQLGLLRISDDGLLR